MEVCLTTLVSRLIARELMFYVGCIVLTIGILISVSYLVVTIVDVIKPRKR